MDWHVWAWPRERTDHITSNSDSAQEMHFTIGSTRNIILYNSYFTCTEAICLFESFFKPFSATRALRWPGTDNYWGLSSCFLSNLNLLVSSGYMLRYLIKSQIVSQIFGLGAHLDVDRLANTQCPITSASGSLSL
jgi:hypothetical protein